jgi:hypothetical protein
MCSEYARVRNDSVRFACMGVLRVRVRAGNTTPTNVFRYNQVAQTMAVVVLVLVALTGRRLLW